MRDLIDVVCVLERESECAFLFIYFLQPVFENNMTGSGRRHAAKLSTTGVKLMTAMSRIISSVYRPPHGDVNVCLVHVSEQ